MQRFGFQSPSRLCLSKQLKVKTFNYCKRTLCCVTKNRFIKTIHTFACIPFIGGSIGFWRQLVWNRALVEEQQLQQLTNCCFLAYKRKYGCLVPLFLFILTCLFTPPPVVVVWIPTNDCSSYWEAQASVISENTLLRRYIVTNGKAILRYALPIPVDEPIRELQSTLELLLIDLHSPGKSGLSLAWKDIQKAEQILHKSEVEILLDIEKEHRDEAAVALGDVDELLGIIQDKVQLAKKSKKAIKDMKNEIAEKTEISLDKVAQLEEWMVKEFPYSIPHRYDSLPRLKGRALVEMTITKGSHSMDSMFRDKCGNPIGTSVHLVAVLDGYSAPLTSGNFIEVLLNNTYRDATVVDKDSNFYLLFQPKRPFIDPHTKQPRKIPMEVLVDGDPYPIWGKTLESADLADLQPVLPMTAFGAIAMVHSDEDENDANSSFFIFLLDPRSEQARNKGGNILNGNVATFGYIVEGLEYLSQISPKDTLSQSRILNGIDKWERIVADILEYEKIYVPEQPTSHGPDILFKLHGRSSENNLIVGIACKGRWSSSGIRWTDIVEEAREFLNPVHDQLLTRHSTLHCMLIILSTKLATNVSNDLSHSSRCYPPNVIVAEDFVVPHNCELVILSEKDVEDFIGKEILVSLREAFESTDNPHSKEIGITNLQKLVSSLDKIC